jgi:uncharacterized protein YihD (DUF1040 family)
MTRQQAASALRISVRSLQRIVQKGRLSVTYVPGRTRPVPVFEEAEVYALRESLFARPQYPQARTAAERTRKQSFGFRVAPEDIELLATEGAKCQMSAGQYARYLVRLGTESGLQRHVDKLTDDISVLQAQADRYEETLRHLRKDFSDTIEIVLEVAGMHGDEARHWVDENLRSS